MATQEQGKVVRVKGQNFDSGFVASHPKAEMFIVNHGYGLLEVVHNETPRKGPVEVFRAQK